MRVPQVRFKGFSDEWETNILGNLMDVTSVKRVHQSDWKKTGIRFYRARDIVAIAKNECISDPLYISESLYCEYSKTSGKVKIGDLLVTGVGTIGVPMLILDNLPIYFKDGNIIWFKNEGTINPQYLYYSFINAKTQKFIQESAGTGTVGTYTIDTGKKTPILLPQFLEQTKIGKFFKDIDKAIALEEQKHTKLMQMKKALLEKMFPKESAQVPEIRFHGFSGTWDKKLMGDCVLIQRGGSPRPIDSYLTDNNDGVNWIKIGDVKPSSRYITSTKEKIIPSGEKYSRKVRKGDLILSNSMSFGRPYIMLIEGCIHDGWLLLHDEKELFNAEYLLQLLSTQYMYAQYKALASGGVVNNLNCELVKATTITVPDKAEQTKIGKLFKTLDKRLTLQQVKIEKLQNIKKALLEKMFV